MLFIKKGVGALGLGLGFGVKMQFISPLEKDSLLLILKY